MSVASTPCSGSPDITTLAYSILYDISGGVPAITLTNASTVINPSLLKWWYVISTPSGTPIHTGTLASPDVSFAAWSTLAITPGTWPLYGDSYCGQVEFSGNSPYICTLYVIDSDNNTFSLQVLRTITRPTGNTQKSCGNFGVAAVMIETKCNDHVVFCSDSTNFTYQNILLPDSQSNVWTLTYPADPNGNVPTPGAATNTPYVNFPIGYSGDGYVLSLRDYATYDMGNGSYVKVQYKAINSATGTAGVPFAVLCNIDLCKLQCQIQTYVTLALKTCGNVVDPSLQSKIARMNLLLNQAIIGIMQPLCGINVPAIIAQIQEIGELDDNCDCGCTDTGINFVYPISGNSSSGGCCPVSVDIINRSTSPVTSCADTTYPVQVFDPTNTAVIGIATDINQVLGLLNSNAAWQAYGVAFSEGPCMVGWFPVTAGNTIPDVYVATPSSTCIGNEQSYSVSMHDVCLETLPINITDFPLNAYVNFGDGEVYLGNVASMVDLITALNGAPTKPSTVTFSDAGASFNVVINIYNSSCTDFSDPITISTDIGSASFLLYGSSHANYSSTPYAVNGGEVGVGLRTSENIGVIPGLSTSNIQWHTIRIGTTLIASESNTGKIYFWDITIPLQPVFIRYIQLNSVVVGCFSGLPTSKGVDNGSVQSYYSLYFPTDYSNMALSSIYVFESLTGSAWQINMFDTGSGVTASFQANVLIGACPRCIVGTKLYLTIDGTLATDIGGSAPYLDGYIGVLNLASAFNSGALSTVNIAGLGTTDPIWAATYDGVDTIWFMGVNGVLYKYTVSLGSAGILTGAMGVLGGFKLRGNMKFYLNKLYCSSLGGLKPLTLNIGAMSIDVSTYPTLTQVFFEGYTSDYSTNKYVHNILPLGNCLVLVTAEGYTAASPAGPESGVVAVYKTDGTFLSQIELDPGQNIYNLIAIPGVSVYTPTTLV